MTNKLQAKPITASIILTVILSVLWGFTSPFVRGISAQHGLLVSSLLTSVINIVFALITIAILGIINQTCGFKHVFKTEGFVKGLPAVLPIMAAVLFNLAFVLSSAETISGENLSTFPLHAFVRITSAFIETVLFRGLLVTALFVKLSLTESERIRSIFKASALFLMIYMLGILNTGNVNIIPIINTFIINAGFCAAYMYSRNLIVLFLAYGTWMTLIAILDVIVVDDSGQASPLLFFAVVGVLFLILTFAVRFSRRAEPFCLDKSNPTVD